MPTDTSEFTLSLFDTTALSSWTHHTPSIAADSYDADDADTEADDDTPPLPADPVTRGVNFHLAADRDLAPGWPARARDNIGAITLSKALEQSGRAPTPDEQGQLLRFIGFGATELAQTCFRRPGEDAFRSGWQEIGAALEAAVTAEEYAALQRATQYAHYTPETIIRALWRVAGRLGFAGGRVLEPGMGTGLFFALLPAALRERGVHEFDAWASAFGDTSTELELQPSGAYKPVTRFAAFINVADLMMMFRSVADVVQKADLRGYLALPRIRGGQRQLITAEASPAFKDYQRHLARRIAAIEARTGRLQKGDDILLSVITDGRHAAIDLRLVWPDSGDEPANKLNKLIDTAHRIWAETAAETYLRPDGTPYPIPGAGQMIFSDLGTISVEATRGFSAYRWIKQRLIARGVPAGQIAFMQDYKRSADKQRLFADFRAGRVRVLIGSSDTMGTGVNVQQRLAALHHLDVPWLPSQIEQREGRIERQGNQHGEIDIYAYATLGSMDATMWQNNERKARFIEAALSGDRTIRRIEDAGSQANQFAMAKAIASGDSRLMRKAGLESEIARLQRQCAAHVDDQHAVRRQIRDARLDQANAEGRISAITADLARRQPTRGDQFTIDIEGRTITQRKAAGAALLTKVRLALRERTGRSWTVGRFGGFDLTCALRADRHDLRPEPDLVLERTDFAQPIALDGETTAVGIIARLEHALDRMEAELGEQRRRVTDATARLAGYASRLGETFPLQGELDAKLALLAEIEADLARTEGVVSENQSAVTPV